MRQSKNQLGFSTLVVVLVIAVVAVLAVSGVVVYQHHKSSSTKTSTKNSAATSPNQTTSQPTSTTTTQPATTTTQYLTITQWGVKIPLSSSINDAYYVVNTSAKPDASGQPYQMLLGFKSLDSSGCAASNNVAPVLLARGSPSTPDAVTGKPISQTYPGVTIGNYFYGYSLLTGNKACSSHVNFQTLDAEMTTAIKGTVPATN
jgi:cytoskeletal protein RodZ